MHYLDMQNFFDIKLTETFYSKCWLSFIFINIKVEVILREYSKFWLILKKNLDYMFSDATAYNNSGYCHNYRLTCWCTTLIRVKWFRSRHDMASVYLIAVRCASPRRLIYKNERSFLDTNDVTDTAAFLLLRLLLQERQCLQ